LPLKILATDEAVESTAKKSGQCCATNRLAVALGGKRKRQRSTDWPDRCDNRAMNLLAMFNV